LFGFSFSTFVTAKVVKFLYSVAIGGFDRPFSELRNTVLEYALTVPSGQLA
jgi:hypothetical protein